MPNSAVNTDRRSSILIVDDDPEILMLVSRYLEKEGFRVDTASDTQEAGRMLAVGRFDLVVLDLMMPGEDGLSFARSLRASSDIPILMLTSKIDVIDRVVGLEVGADDYMTKPFDLRELLARVRSLLRRSHQALKDEQAAPALKICFAGWQLDLSAHQLTSPTGEKVHLTTYEFRLLAAFVERPKRVLTRDQILDAVADRASYPYDRSIDVLVSKLRHKIEDEPGDPVLIKTVRGEGYMFAVSVENA